MKNAIQHDVSLEPFNTMGVAARARYFLPVTTTASLAAAFDRVGTSVPVLVLGGGSNILFTRDFEGLVLKNDLKGISVLDEAGDQVRVRAAAGEDWHMFVCWCLRQGFYGLENLSLIPGTVGAAPVQNIGAYGVEAGDRIDCVEALDLETGRCERFDAQACAFVYRGSIFKTCCRGRFLITGVTFRLARTARMVTGYADVQRMVAACRGDDLTPQRLSEVVCQIRRHKLPDPATLANVGSFFKNPVVSRRRYRDLADRFPDLPAHPADDGRVKLAAAWMIEQCGWKGRRTGACGVYAGHALVLVNYGGASGRDILRLAEAVQDAVESTFGLRLEPEPLIL